MGYTNGPWYRMGKTVYALNPRGFNRFSACVQDAKTPDDELVSNAILIQHAPDLLEALEASPHMLHILPEGGECRCSQCDFVRLRDAAIKRAKGDAE